MANEITITTSMSVRNGDLVESVSENTTYDQSSQLYTGGVQTVGTTHEALDLGDVTTPGPVWFLNLDDTNYVEIGLDDAGTFMPFGVAEAGKPGGPLKPASGVTWYVRANTAPVNIRRAIPST